MRKTFKSGNVELTATDDELDISLKGHTAANIDKSDAEALRAFINEWADAVGMARLAPFVQSFADGLGKPVPAGRVYLYKAGTMEPAEVFQNAVGNIPATHPVILNGRGEMAVWVDPTLKYKVVLQDSRGHGISMVDNYSVTP